MAILKLEDNDLHIDDSNESNNSRTSPNPIKRPTLTSGPNTEYRQQPEDKGYQFVLPNSQERQQTQYIQGIQGIHNKMSVLDSSIDRIMNVINLAGGQNKNT